MPHPIGNDISHRVNFTTGLGRATAPALNVTLEGTVVYTFRGERLHLFDRTLG